MTELNPLDKDLIPPGARIEIPLHVSIDQLREIVSVLARLVQHLEELTQSNAAERHIRLDAWWFIRQARENILRLKQHGLGTEGEEGDFRRTLSGDLVKLER